MAQATGWVIKNQTLVAAGIILLVGAFGIVYSMDSVKKSGTAEAAEAFTKPLMPISGSKHLLQLEPASDTNSPESFAKAQRDFSNARKMYADQPVAILAALGEASSQLDLGNPAEAVKLYDEVLAKPALGPFAQIIAHQGRATALEAAGKTADAIAAWNAMGQIDNKNLGLFAGSRPAVYLRRKIRKLRQKRSTANSEEIGRPRRIWQRIQAHTRTQTRTARRRGLSLTREAHFS